MMLNIKCQEPSPFLRIPASLRALLAVYIVLFYFFFPVTSYALSPDYTGLWFVPRLLTETIYVVLLIFPLIYYKPNFGWLHPLILPTLITIIKNTFKEPYHVFLPFDLPVRSFHVETNSAAYVLRSLPLEDLEFQRLCYTAIQVLFLSIYYATYFTCKASSINLHLRPPNPIRLKVIVIGIVAVSLLTTLYFINAQGGLSQHMLALIAPRFSTLAGSGHVIELVGVAGTALLVWAAYVNGAFRDPLYLVMICLVFVAVVIAQGSRSSGVFLLISIGIVWMLRKQRIPMGWILIGAIAMFVFFGAFGQLRQQFDAKTVDWTVISALDVESWLDSAVEEASKRKAEESSFAAFVGANKFGHLYGRSYVHGVFFWVPRAMWKEKPRGPGAYNNYQNFGGDTLTDRNPIIGGRPVGPVVEAYWNFHIPGVMLVAIMMGWFHKLLVNMVLRYRREPGIWVFYTIVVTGFSGGTLGFVDTVREVITMLAILVALGVIGPLRNIAKRKSGIIVGASVTRYK